MLPVKAYVGAMLKKTDDHARCLDSRGVLVVYREEPTSEELAALSREEAADLVHGESGYRESGYGNFAFRFYPLEKQGYEYVGKDPASLSWDTCLQINFAHGGSVDEFDLAQAVGVDFECINALGAPMVFGHGLDELFLAVLRGIVSELRHSDPELFRQNVVSGMECEYLHRLDASGATLDSFGTFRLSNLRHDASPFAQYGIYAEGEEVCFKGGTLRGVVRGLDRSDARYTSGKIVDVYCAEQNMVYKEVPIAGISGVFDSIEHPGHTDRVRQAQERKWPPIEDSICEAQRKLFAATDGVVGCADWPRARYRSGQVVIFREHSQAPFQRGIIVGVPCSRGNWAPRGAYYDVECPQRLTTIIRLPETNIHQVLGSVGCGIDEEPWMKRANLCWNACVDGGSFDMHPASQSRVVEYWQNIAWAGRLDTYAHRLNIDEYDFHLFVEDLFEGEFDNENPANVERQRQDGKSQSAQGFDWYGDNFYSLESARAILCEVFERSVGDTEDFYSRFGTLFEAVVEKAEALNAEPGSKGDFGILVVGP